MGFCMSNAIVVVSCEASYSLLVYNLNYTSLHLYHIVRLQWTSYFFTCYSVSYSYLKALKSHMCRLCCLSLFPTQKHHTAVNCRTQQYFISRGIK